MRDPSGREGWQEGEAAAGSGADDAVVGAAPLAPDGATTNAVPEPVLQEALFRLGLGLRRP